MVLSGASQAVETSVVKPSAGPRICQPNLFQFDLELNLKIVQKVQGRLFLRPFFTDAFDSALALSFCATLRGRGPKGVRGAPDQRSEGSGDCKAS